MGLVFSGLFIAALVVVNGVPHLGAPDAAYGTFYDGAGNTVVTAVALYLVPLAGIAFLWFVVALRSVLDTLAPAPSAMANGLNLLSGVLFVALLFAGTAALATPAAAPSCGRGVAAPPRPPARPPAGAGGGGGARPGGAPPLSPEAARALSGLGYGLVFVFSVRGAGMFALTTTTLLRSAGVLPKIPAVVAYLLAAFLLLAVTKNPAALLVFPAWVALISVFLLRHARRGGAPVAHAPTPGPAAPLDPTGPSLRSDPS